MTEKLTVLALNLMLLATTIYFISDSVLATTNIKMFLLK